MAKSELEELIAGCDRFLGYHTPRTVRERLLEIAESPLSLKRQDNYGTGGFVSEFEVEIAELLGKETAVFMPSGTMAQQIALRIWADEAGNPRTAFHPTCHLEIHEQSAYRELHRLEAVLLGDGDRLFTMDDLGHAGEISSVLIELPQREIGGQLPSWGELSEICKYARGHDTKLHLDGARLWECQPYFGRSYSEMCAPFDSVYVSFYKILGGLPGAILAGPAELIRKARVWQRRHGGNLQTQAPVAISAKLGMERHLPKIAQYVAKAQEIADILRDRAEARLVPVRPPTNMMHLHFLGDTERLTRAARQIAQEDRVFLFYALPANGKMELTVGEAALAIQRAELERLFDKLFDLSR